MYLYDIISYNYSILGWTMSGRHAGSRNVLLTKRDRRAMLRDLKAKALAGDSSAATAALLIDQSLRQEIKVRMDQDT